MLVKAQKNVLVKEFLNWTLLILVVAILSLLLSRVAGGVRPMADDKSPGTLPPMGEVATPMATMPEVPRESGPSRGNDFDLITEVWTDLELHRAREMDEAIAGWKELTLPCDTAVWRDVGLGAAYLRAGDVEAASDALGDAIRLEPNNAVLHYYQALVLMTMSVESGDWYDAIETPNICFVSLSPRQASELYQLAAIDEFERAIELAKDVDMDLHLVPPVVFAGAPLEFDEKIVNPMFVSQPNDELIRPLYENPLPLEPPTVGDLLTAIQAEEFEGTAHNMLAPLYLDRGSLEQAEEHLDAAVAFEMNVLDGYEQLADRYEARGQYGDAFRANLKAIGRSNGFIGPVRKALESIRRSLDEPR